MLFKFRPGIPAAAKGLLGIAPKDAAGDNLRERKGELGMAPKDAAGDNLRERECLALAF